MEWNLFEKRLDLSQNLSKVCVGPLWFELKYIVCTQTSNPARLNQYSTSKLCVHQILNARRRGSHLRTTKLLPGMSFSKRSNVRHALCKLQGRFYAPYLVHALVLADFWFTNKQVSQVSQNQEEIMLFVDG